MKSNYEITLQNAMKRFCSYDMTVLSQRPGVTDGGEYLQTRFFGMNTKIFKKTGEITVDGQPADFCEALSVFDWLCDRKENAKASGEFCPVHSLPGVVVRGKGLTMDAPELAQRIEKDITRFQKIIQKMDGKTINLGDFGAEIEIFPELPMQMKFYYSDEEFPPSITFLWDKNILNFVRYETVYYLCGTIKKHLLTIMNHILEYGVQYE